MVWHPEKEEVLGFILLNNFYPFLNDPLCVEMICWLLDVWNFSALLLSVSSFLFHCRYARVHVSVINQATFSVNGALLRLLACDLIYFFCKHVSIAPTALFLKQISSQLIHSALVADICMTILSLLSPNTSYFHFYFQNSLHFHPF